MLFGTINVCVCNSERKFEERGINSQGKPMLRFPLYPYINTYTYIRYVFIQKHICREKKERSSISGATSQLTKMSLSELIHTKEQRKGPLVGTRTPKRGSCSALSPVISRELD